MTQAIHFKSRHFVASIISAVFIYCPWAFGFELTEDFSNPKQADYANSTGLWNSFDHQAQGAVVANADPARPISFGDGSDGAVNSNIGFVFDTDSHLNGYNFISLSILSGPVVVRGSHPLVIRSLGAVTFATDLIASGGNGVAGTLNSSNTVIGGLGGSARAGGGTGGVAGSIAATAAGMAGGAGLKNDGTPDPSTSGNGSTNGGAAAFSGTQNVAMPTGGLTFDSGGFIAAGGGGGGGGHAAAGDPVHATGGAGGAGGGAIWLSAVGPISVNSVSAAGGNGGISKSSSSQCSGNGAGGHGGAAWLQSLHSITAPTEPDVSPGDSGAANPPCLYIGLAQPGYTRADSPPPAPNWTSAGGEVFYDTRAAAPSQSYQLMSKAYDLKTLNASFASDAMLNETLNGGSVTVEFGASTDGAVYTDFTPDLKSLSGRGYRYLKIKLKLTTASAAGPSPVVKQIKISYGEQGTSHLDLTLGTACGSLMITNPENANLEKARNPSNRNRPKSAQKSGVFALFFWLAGFSTAWATIKIRSA